MYNIIFAILVMVMLGILVKIIYMIYREVKEKIIRWKQVIKEYRKEQEKREFATRKKKERIERKRKEERRKKREKWKTQQKQHIQQKVKRLFSSYRFLVKLFIGCFMCIGFLVISDKVIFLQNIDMIDKKIKPIISLLMLLVFNIVIIQQVRNNKGIEVKFITVYLLLNEIIATGMLAIKSGLINYKENKIISCCIMLLVFIYILYILSVKFLNPWIANTIVVLLYVMIIVIGGIAFGGYYINTFSEKFQNEINLVNKLVEHDYWRSISIILKVGIRPFYQFPPEDIYCKISLFQFWLGKVSDLLFLSYIVSKFKIVGDK